MCQLSKILGTRIYTVHAFTSMSSPTNRSSAQDLQKETPGTSKLDEFIISMSFERCDSEPVLCRRRAGRDPAERRFLHFLHDYSQKHRPLSQAQITALVQPWPDGHKTLQRSGSQPSRPKSGPAASPMTAMLRRPKLSSSSGIPNQNGRNSTKGTLQNSDWIACGSFEC